MIRLIHNATVYVDRGHFETAIAIEDDTIVAVGNQDRLLAQYPQAQRWDAHGCTIVPGFNDSHQHLMLTGEALCSVSLHGCRGIGEMIDRARRHLADNPLADGEVLYGMGWNQDYFEDEPRMPTRHDLDRISTRIPIIFDRVCTHILVCNTRALELAGITPQTRPVEGGAIDVDQGELTGIVRENACGMVKAIRHADSVQAKMRFIQTAMRHAARRGVTSVQTNDVRGEDWENTLKAYDAVLSQTPELRVWHQCHFQTPEQFSRFLVKGYRMGQGNDFNRIGPLKLFADGSLGARTALLRQDYADAPGQRGIAAMTPKQISQMALMAHAHGFGVMTHAIGDAAIENVIDSYGSLCANANPLRHGIVHVQITDRDLLERMAGMGVVALVQPIFLHYDIGIVRDRVGEAIASSSYAFATMLRLSIPTAFGTDSPVEDMDPISCIHCAVNRRRLDRDDEAPFNPSERVDVAQAVDCYTIGSAYASFDELRKGRIRPGFLADLTVLDRNIFTIDPMQIRCARVVATMVGGEFVYEVLNETPRG